jgi:hypothetical protein
MPWVGYHPASTPSAADNGQAPEDQQPRAKPAQVHPEPRVLSPSSSTTASVASHNSHVEGTQQQQPAQVCQQPLPPTILTRRSQFPLLAHPRQQLLLNSVVEPLRHNHKDSHRCALDASSPTALSCSSSADEEESNSSSDDNSNLVVMTEWGKPFYFLDGCPIAEAATNAKLAPPTTTLAIMPQPQQQRTSSSHRPLPPAPRIFISEPPPLTSTVALDFDELALDFFMDDVS